MRYRLKENVTTVDLHRVVVTWCLSLPLLSIIGEPWQMHQQLYKYNYPGDMGERFRCSSNSASNTGLAGLSNCRSRKQLDSNNQQTASSEPNYVSATKLVKILQHAAGNVTLQCVVGLMRMPPNHRLAWHIVDTDKTWAVGIIKRPFIIELCFGDIESNSPSYLLRRPIDQQRRRGFCHSNIFPVHHLPFSDTSSIACVCLGIWLAINHAD